MTQSPSPSGTVPSHPITNPYVGPRTFTEKEQRFFFGREREARDLTARIVSERLLLFYAQSGAGKSSLLNARVIPRLRDDERFQALPVGRVSGELPAGVAQVDNIYAFNLMTSLDQSGEHPQRLAQVTLSDFLARLARATAVDAAGQRTARWVYKPEIAVARPADDVAASTASGPRFALVIDQFEEVITAHPGRWREREGFFRQLNQALLDDPNLWVVLSLREDYVASLDPYAELLFNRLRARFYMERMQVDAALDAIRRPAELAGRPFAPGVAEKLADDLRRVRVAGLEGTVPGQYVEPVQLQVVCFQMWENLGKGEDGEEGKEGNGEGKQITLEDLTVAGDVDQALTQFYEETLALALADLDAPGTSERQVRTWFDRELITEAGTRGLVHQGEAETGGLPNGVVKALQRRFLVRGEARGGDVWIELVHDRFVEPIRASNAAWFPQHLSPLQRQAALWNEQGRSDGLLLSGKALAKAEAWAAAQEAELESHERDFLKECKLARKQAERERKQKRLIGTLAVVVGLVAVLALVLFFNAREQTQRAKEQEALAIEAKQQAEAQETLASAGTLIAFADTALRIDEYNRAVLLTVESLRAALVKEALGSALRTNLHPWHSVLYLDDSLYGPAIWSSDGARLVTGGADGNVNVWDTETGKQLMHIVGHDGAVTGMAWGHDETRVLTQGVDNTVRIWDMESGTEVLRLRFDADGAAHMVNSASGQDVFRTAEGIPDDYRNLGQFLLGEDGNHFAALFGDGKFAHVWDLRSGEEVLRIEADEYGARELDLNPRQNRVVAVSDDGTTRVWDTKGGTAPFILEDVKELFWNRDGSQVVAASEQGPAVLWDIERKHMLTTLNDFTGSLNAAAWSRDGSRIVTVSDDRSILVWDARNGERLNTIESPVDVLDIAWSQDDKNILALYSTGHGYSGSEISIWAADSGNEVITFPSQYGEDGSSEARDLYLAGCNVLYEPRALRNQMQEAIVYGCEVRVPLWSQDGSRILDSREDSVNRGTLQLWNTDGAELLRMVAFPPYEQHNRTQSISWSPTGGHILLYDGLTMELRALSNRDDSLDLHASYSQADPDGFSVSGSINRSIGEDGLLGVNYFSQSMDEVFGLDNVDYSLSNETLADARDRFRENLIADICSIVPRNMTWEEWQTSMRLSYSPTCPEASIPTDVIWGIREQAAALAQTGDLASAADRVSELVGWLQENGQYDRSGSEPAEWLEALKAGKSPWATE